MFLVLHERLLKLDQMLLFLFVFLAVRSHLLVVHFELRVLKVDDLLDVCGITSHAVVLQKRSHFRWHVSFDFHHLALLVANDAEVFLVGATLLTEDVETACYGEFALQLTVCSEARVAEDPRHVEYQMKFAV
jgi:uncharacterized protein (DUF488 family)